MLFLYRSYLSRLQFVPSFLRESPGKSTSWACRTAIHPATHPPTPNHSRPQRESAGRLTRRSAGAGTASQVCVRTALPALRCNGLLDADCPTVTTLNSLFSPSSIVSRHILVVPGLLLRLLAYQYRQTLE